MAEKVIIICHNCRKSGVLSEGDFWELRTKINANAERCLNCDNDSLSYFEEDEDDD